MIDDVAWLVHPVFLRALAFRELLEKGEVPEFEQSQNELIGCLSPEVSPAWSRPGLDDARYALTCWLDEVFIEQPSPWSRRWNERKLEVALFQSNDRAWKFWRQARRVLSMGDSDSLEVFLLCVFLGFRGELTDDPRRLQEWVGASRRLVESRMTAPWVEPPRREPESFIPPLRGRRRLRAATIRLGLVALVTIPPLVFLLILSLSG